MNDLVADGVAKAEGDFNTAQRELRARRAPNYDAVCFHAQESAEKYLKGFLQGQGEEPPKIHNLIRLLDRCQVRDNSFEMIRANLEALETFAVEVRYPGNVASKEEARDAGSTVKQVREFVSERLGL